MRNFFGIRDSKPVLGTVAQAAGLAATPGPKETFGIKAEGVVTTRKKFREFRKHGIFLGETGFDIVKVSDSQLAFGVVISPYPGLPSLVLAKTWLIPQTTLWTPSRGIFVGKRTSSSCSLPKPSWPFVFCPKPKRLPSSISTIEKYFPQATRVGFLFSGRGTWHGESLASMSPCPSCPQWFFPIAKTLWSLVRNKKWLCPAAKMRGS
jgi:hypothetical protein